MTTTTCLYKQDQMTGKFKGQTQASVNEDRIGSYSCICALWWQREELPHSGSVKFVRGQLKRDGTRAETRFRLSAKRTSPFKSAGASLQLTTGSRGVRISSYCW
jgi:hypothetical protein